MFDGTKHRKFIKHYPGPGICHELTWCCFGQRFLLCTPDRRDLVQQAIQRFTTRYGFATLAFVIMSNHVHLLVRPRTDPYDLSALLKAIKKPSSFQIKKRMQKEGDPVLPDLMIREPDGSTVFRLWEAGPGYDRNMLQDTLNAAVRYIHLNPVRAGLCEHAEDWPWSSAGWYHREAIGPDGGVLW